MKYFVDQDRHWDADGYWAQYETLRPRLSPRTFELLRHDGFHDSYLVSISVRNRGRKGLRRSVNPTQVDIEFHSEAKLTLHFAHLHSSRSRSKVRHQDGWPRGG